MSWCVNYEYAKDVLTGTLVSPPCSSQSWLSPEQKHCKQPSRFSADRPNQPETHSSHRRPETPGWKKDTHIEDKLILYQTETCEQHKKNLRLTAKFNFPRAIKQFKLCRKQCSTWCYWWRKICPNVQFLRLFCMYMILEYGTSWGSFYYLKQDHHWFDEISKPEPELYKKNPHTLPCTHNFQCFGRNTPPR